MNSPTEKHKSAYRNVQQAIREENYWLVAWWMKKSLKDHHQLTKEQQIWLETERKIWTHRANNLSTRMELFVKNDASNDLSDWLGKAGSFGEILSQSLKHQEKPEFLHLRDEFLQCIRAAGSLRAIIQMANHTCLNNSLKKCDEFEEIEMEAMSAPPGADAFKTMVLEDENWVLIRREEVDRYHESFDPALFDRVDEDSQRKLWFDSKTIFGHVL